MRKGERRNRIGNRKVKHVGMSGYLVEEGGGLFIYMCVGQCA